LVDEHTRPLAQAESAAEALEQGGVASPVLAEAEVRPDHHVARADVPGQDLLDELLGRQGREFGAERLDQHDVGTGLRE
jgi:hypothetical protein